MSLQVAARIAPVSLVFDGQSLNRVGGYPSKCQLGLPYTSFFTTARSGHSMTALALDFATRTAQHAKIGSVNVLVITGGQTDLTDGDSAAQVRTDKAAYADLAYAAGFDHVVCTTIPCAKIPDYYSSGQNTIRGTFNSALVSTGVSSGDFDAVADIASATGMGTWSGTYFDDSVHWNATGAQSAADVVKATLETLLGL
jgi:hypothetical protein